MGEYKRKSREERIKEIHAAAVKVFLEKGYRNTTMEDVVNATTLSKGGLYHYYGSTKEIIFDMMNYGNINYLSNLKIDAKWTKEELCHYVTEKMVEKSLVPTPYRRLYLMFCMEALYDKDFENLFKKLEKEAVTYLGKCLASCENVKYESKNSMSAISRIMNALIFVQNVFSEPEILLDKKTLIYDFYYKIFWSMLS